MTFEADLKAHLQQGAIQAMVGARIAPQPLPEGSDKPAITYLVIGEDPHNDLDGEDGELLEIRVQVDCWALTDADVRALSELVRTRLKTSGFKATPITGTAFGQYETQTKLHRFTRDYQCWYRL